MSVITSVNRLLRLADLLRYSVDPDDFDMGAWVGKHARSQKKAKCGTVACIGGWATAIHPKLELTGDDIIYRPVAGSRKNLRSGVGAFAEAFDLDFNTAYRLTDACAPHRTPKQAARAVEKVAAALAENNDLEIVLA